LVGYDIAEASKMLFSFASSESDLEVNTIGADAPRMTEATLESEK